MALLRILVSFALVARSLALQASAPPKVSDPSSACAALKQRYPNITILPGEDEYTTENQVAWTTSAWLGPACIFVPTRAADLSFAIRTLVKTSTLFSMRGGGHMPISDAANINSTGVLISSTNLNTLKLSKDKQTLSVGSGPRWGDVFNYLDGTNLTVVGGRFAPVGVPGLLLGGGISFYSYKHGLASAGGKIKAYEAVLADGTIATVTANNKYSDLYWALGGGGNSFALITRFDLQTLPSVTPLMAQAIYSTGTDGTGNDTRDAYLDAVFNFALQGDQDTHAAIIPVARWGSGFTSPSYQSALFYNGTTAPSTGPFAEFIHGTTTGLSAINGSATLIPISLSQYGSLVREAFKPGGESYGKQQKFHVVSTKASFEALRIVHDTFFASLITTDIANRIPGFHAGLAFNPVTRTFAAASAGLPQNVPQEPAFWVEQSVSWGSENDSPAVEEWARTMNAEIDEKLRKIDGASPYLYLNDADMGQKVFEGYGSESVKKLKSIREKYDSGRIFTDLMPGGFKVDHAEL